MLIKHIKVSGLLSFGPKGIDLPMRKLNVLIGANGSGKSNLLEVINLFRAAPSPLYSIEGPIMDDGGIDEWEWKGYRNMGDEPPPAQISCVVSGIKKGYDVRHDLEFYSSNHRLSLASESIEMANPPKAGAKAWWFYRMNMLGAQFHDFEMEKGDSRKGIRRMSAAELNKSASILAQVRDPSRYKVFGHLQENYRRIHLYRNWSFGPLAAMRRPSRPNDRNDGLNWSAENLGTVVAKMPGRVQKKMLESLQLLYADIKEVHVRPVAGGNLQLSIEETGGVEIPACRLSDGTLRYLSLLVILLNPEPPPLIAIEEPELGLHPDVIPQIAKLLKEASERTQLIITTHSRQLIDALGDDPESVIVCEKHDGESVFERLDGKRMNVWLEKYSLGDLWSKGEIGGNRW